MIPALHHYFPGVDLDALPEWEAEQIAGLLPHLPPVGGVAVINL